MMIFFLTLFELIMQIVFYNTIVEPFYRIKRTIDL